MDTEATAEPEQMPPPADVERLLAFASSRLGASDAATLAQASARMYSWARAIPGAVTVSARDGDDLVGFGYGYSWDWMTMTDAWSLRLRDELGASAAVLEDSFSVVLLVVAPDHRRSGLGAGLLSTLAHQSDEHLTWLQVEPRSALRGLCESLGWHALDSDGDSLIMLSGAPAVGAR